MSRNIGYARVSHRDQNEARQIIALKKEGIPDTDIYVDKFSGKDFNRPQYQKMLSEAHEGDCIFILSIDRLGRNYEEMIEQWNHITKELKVDIVVLDMPLLDTRKEKNLIGAFISDIVLYI
ncbi:MAG: recombinase family protein, partial [Butyrivibrio sp.]|nr:recombinase family protein [Butyrivibrio sp.]